MWTGVLVSSILKVFNFGVTFDYIIKIETLNRGLSCDFLSLVCDISTLRKHFQTPLQILVSHLLLLE